MKEPVLIIDALEVIKELDYNFDREHSQWESQCKAVHNAFKKKTSRMEKNGKSYEYTKWYREKSGGGLECIGSQEPDFKKYYPAEPKPHYSFGYREYDGHIVLEKTDYQANLALFKECLGFRLEDCQNRIHVLYANPEKALKEYESDSVWKCGVSSERTSGGAGQKREIVSRDFDLPEGCLGDGDCDSCEHNDECPVNDEGDDNGE